MQWLDRIQLLHAFLVGLHDVFLTVFVRVSSLFTSGVALLSDHFTLVSLAYGLRLRCVIVILTRIIASFGLHQTGFGHLDSSFVLFLALVLLRSVHSLASFSFALFSHLHSTIFAFVRLWLFLTSATLCAPLSVPSAFRLGVAIAFAPASASSLFILHAPADATGTWLWSCTFVTSFVCWLLI